MKKGCIFLAFVLFFCKLSNGISSRSRRWGHQTIRPPMDPAMAADVINNRTLKIISDLQDDSLREQLPPGRRPLPVKVKVMVLGVSDISELNMQFTLSLYLEMSWVDPRLKYDPGTSHVTLHPDNIQKIWRPDIFFRNEKGSSLSTRPSLSNSVLKIHPDRRIFLSRKLETTLRCKMKFHAFPFDKQYCPLDIISYGYETNLFSIVWKYENPLAFHGEFFEPAGFSLRGAGVSDFTEFLSSGQFSGARAAFHLKRDSGFYILQVWCLSSDKIFIRI